MLFRRIYGMNPLCRDNSRFFVSCLRFRLYVFLNFKRIQGLDFLCRNNSFFMPCLSSFLTSSRFMGYSISKRRAPGQSASADDAFELLHGDRFQNDSIEPLSLYLPCISVSAVTT